MDVRLISFETHQHYTRWMKKHQWSKPHTFPGGLLPISGGHQIAPGPKQWTTKKGKSHKFTIHLHCLITPPKMASHLMIPADFFWFPSFNAFEKQRWKWATSPHWRGCCSRVYFAHASDGCSKRRPPSKGDKISSQFVRWLEIPSFLWDN